LTEASFDSCDEGAESDGPPTADEVAVETATGDEEEFSHAAREE
jgi:hypothetical protein